jgi:hypothetical protein
MEVNDGTNALVWVDNDGNLFARGEIQAFAGGSGSTSTSNSQLAIENNQGDVLTTDAASLQFTGDGVSLTQSGDDITVDVSGGSSVGSLSDLTDVSSAVQGDGNVLASDGTSYSEESAQSIFDNHVSLSASDVSGVSADSVTDAHHAVFEPADYTPGNDVSKSDVGLGNVPNVNPRSEMRNLGLSNQEMDSSWVGGQSGGQVGYDASVGLFLDYGSSGSGVSKDVYPVLDAGNTTTGSNVNVTYNGIDSRPKISLSQGSESGLNADKIDGFHASQFMRDDFESSGDLNNDSKSGIYRFDNNESNRPGSISFGTLVTFNNTKDTGFQLVGDYQNDSGGLYWRGGNSSTFGGSGSSTPWLKIWHEGNDGSGSGLDADKVDGYQGSDLAALAENETVTGQYTFTSLLEVRGVLLPIAEFVRNDSPSSKQSAQIKIKGTDANHFARVTLNDVWSVEADRNNGDLSFYESGNGIQAVIQSGGNVGIGTTTPSYALEVSGDVRSTGEQEAFLGSDRRLKTHITPIDGALDTLEEIGGYGFEWHDEDAVQPHKRGEADVGLIAQEVENVLPEAVKTFSDGHSEGYKSVSYDKVVPLLVEAIKDLRAQVQQLQ